MLFRSGEISDVMQGSRMVTINHQPVPEWDWPGMVMNFTFAEGLDMSEVQRGKAIDFEMRQTESGQSAVIDYKVNKHKIAGEVWVTGDITMLMADFGMITVKHQPVPEWNWKAGEMNFQASDGLDLSEFVVMMTAIKLTTKICVTRLAPVTVPNAITMISADDVKLNVFDHKDVEMHIVAFCINDWFFEFHNRNVNRYSKSTTKTFFLTTYR